MHFAHLTCMHILKISLSIKVLCFLLPGLPTLYAQAIAKAITFSGVLELIPLLAPSYLRLLSLLAIASPRILHHLWLVSLWPVHTFVNISFITFSLIPLFDWAICLLFGCSLINQARPSWRNEVSLKQSWTWL